VDRYYSIDDFFCQNENFPEEIKAEVGYHDKWIEKQH
jgi:hypothetical protein